MEEFGGINHKTQLVVDRHVVLVVNELFAYNDDQLKWFFYLNHPIQYNNGTALLHNNPFVQMVWWLHLT